MIFENKKIGKFRLSKQFRQSFYDWLRNTKSCDQIGYVTPIFCSLLRHLRCSRILLHLRLLLRLYNPPIRFVNFHISSPLSSPKMPSLPKSPSLSAVAELLYLHDQASRSQSPCRPSRLQRFGSTISPNGISSPHHSGFYSSSSESLDKPHACPVTPQMVSTPLLYSSSLR